MRRSLADHSESSGVATMSSWCSLSRNITVSSRRREFLDFFHNSPLAEAMAAAEIDLQRDWDELRDLDL